LLYLEIWGKGNSEDIRNSKALKALKKIIKKLKEHDFFILSKKIFFQGEKIIAILYVFPKELPKYEIKKGPYVWSDKSFDNFFEKHKNEEILIEEDGRISAITKRKYSSIDSLLKDIEGSLLDSIDKICYKLY
ncbi:MAG: hypothetical protein QW648_01020, partial [Nanoarchaeales archaeon]